MDLGGGLELGVQGLLHLARDEGDEAEQEHPDGQGLPDGDPSPPDTVGQPWPERQGHQQHQPRIPGAPGSW